MKNIAYGIHAIDSLLTHQSKKIMRLYFLQQRHDQKIQSLIKTAEQYKINIAFVDKITLDKLSQFGVHQGVVAELNAEQNYHEDDLEILLDKTPEALLLILDGVQDPHNLGACLRTANAAGVTAVITPKHRSAPLNALVRKIACGAAEVTPVIPVTNLARTLRFLRDRNIWLYGTSDKATVSLYQVKFTGACGLILGSEGDGIRRLTRDICDELIYIPMCGTVTSLNVSVATGICLYEAVRQRQP